MKGAESQRTGSPREKRRGGRGAADTPPRNPPSPTPPPLRFCRAGLAVPAGEGAPGARGKARGRAAASSRAGGRASPPPLPPLPPPARGLRERAPGASSLPAGESQPRCRPTDLCSSASFSPGSRARRRWYHGAGERREPRRHSGGGGGSGGSCAAAPPPPPARTSAKNRRR